MVAKGADQVYLTEVICCMGNTGPSDNMKPEKKRPSVGWQISCHSYYLKLVIKTLYGIAKNNSLKHLNNPCMWRGGKDILNKP